MYSDVYLLQMYVSYLSRIMKKPTFCICVYKQRRRRSASRLPRISTSHLLCLYSSICFGPVQKPHCWFCHDAAHLVQLRKLIDHFLRNNFCVGLQFVLIVFDIFAASVFSRLGFMKVFVCACSLIVAYFHNF